MTNNLDTNYYELGLLCGLTARDKQEYNSGTGITEARKHAPVMSQQWRQFVAGWKDAY